MLSSYFKEQEKLEGEFGDKSVVLWENGMFMEVYELNTSTKKIGKCEAVSKDLNMIVSLQSKKDAHSSKNAKMLGFPSVSLSKNLDILLKNGWTVGVWNQHDIKGKEKKERKHFKTFTTTINLNENENLKQNNFMSIYLYNYICPIDKIEKNDLNINILDLNTGDIYSYLYNNKIEITYNELNEIINKYEIIEMIYITNNNEINIDKIINNKNIKIYKKDNDDNLKKIQYQKEFINKFIKAENILNTTSPLCSYPDLIYSLIFLLNFISKCDSNILNKLKLPELYINKYNTIINYDTIFQLNLINNEDNNKYKSILNVIDNCVTLMGKRLLKQRLLNPINDIKELNLRYDKITILKKDDLYKDLGNYLKDIIDLERVYRKINIKQCELIKLADFIYSIKICNKLVKKVHKNKILNELFINKSNLLILDETESMGKYLEDHIDIDILKKYNLNNIKENFFKNNNNNNDTTELLQIESDILLKTKKIEDVANDLTTEDSRDWIKIMQTEKEGFHLMTSKVRYDKLVNKAKYNFTTIKLSNGIKFYNEDIKKWSNEILKLTETLSEMIKIKYLKFLENFSNIYEKSIEKIVNFISDFDVTYSNIITSIMYNFNKPNIQYKDKDESYIEARGLRHVLIELYNQEEKYIVNDILLNKDDLGYLILAPNSCGKSSYLRSVGISLVLAQIGSYVPAKIFNYNPYNKILCKISSVDNIYESRSKFIQDINHMDMFLNSTDNKSLILVDEFLNSTEEFSAAALTAASIEMLTNKNTHFVYTSHINTIIDLLKDNNKIKIKHFDYKIVNNKIIFDRVLKDGIPVSFLYGIEISQHIINDKLFLNRAFEFRNKLLNKQNELLNPKTSSYNKNKVIDKCEICNNEISTILETHHKTEQYKANDFGIIITEENIYPKNIKHNLQILCKICHKNIHKKY